MLSEREFIQLRDSILCMHGINLPVQGGMHILSWNVLMLVCNYVEWSEDGQKKDALDAIAKALKK